MKKTLALLISTALILTQVLVLPIFADNPKDSALIADHSIAKISVLEKITDKQISAVSKLKVLYFRTSHGSQLTSGMKSLTNGLPDRPNFDDGRFTGYNIIEESMDLGKSSFDDITRERLLSKPDADVVMWSWCGQVSSSTEQEINNYLEKMNKLESEFPHVTFVYMTGHLDSKGSGYNGNTNLRNEQIRNYCKANGKVLYDFADIESYDPDDKNFLEFGANDACQYNSGKNNWAEEWRANHIEGIDWFHTTAPHSDSLNGNLKAYGAWWLLTKIAERRNLDGDEPEPTPIPQKPNGRIDSKLLDLSRFDIFGIFNEDELNLEFCIDHKEDEAIDLKFINKYLDNISLSENSLRLKIDDEVSLNIDAIDRLLELKSDLNIISDGINLKLTSSELINIKAKLDKIDPEHNENLEIKLNKTSDNSFFVSLKCGDTDISTNIKIEFEKSENQKDERIVALKIDSDSAIVLRSHYSDKDKAMTIKLEKETDITLATRKPSLRGLENKWYKDAAEFVVTRGIANDKNGNFEAEKQLNRLDFIKSLVIAFGLDQKVPNPTAENFKDTNNYYALVAKELGIIDGDGSNNFLPTHELTREQMFVISYNTLTKLSEMPGVKISIELNSFTDDDEISGWAASAIEAMIKADIVHGNNSKINPKRIITNAEMAQFFLNLLTD